MEEEGKIMTYKHNGPYMRDRKLRKDGEATLAKLLNALDETLAETPVMEVSATAIPRRINMAAATFYQYFPSMRHAVYALADRVADEAASHMRAAVREVAASFRGKPDWDTVRQQKMLRVIEAFEEFCTNNAHVLKAVAAYAVGSGNNASDALERIRNSLSAALLEVALGFRTMLKTSTDLLAFESAAALMFYILPLGVRQEDVVSSLEDQVLWIVSEHQGSGIPGVDE